MDKAAIEQRLTGLIAARDEMLAQLNAQLGAIEDCKWWLEQVGESDSPTSTPEE